MGKKTTVLSSLRSHGGPSIVSAFASRNDPIKDVQINAYGPEINAVTPRLERESNRDYEPLPEVRSSIVLSVNLLLY